MEVSLRGNRGLIGKFLFVPEGTLVRVVDFEGVGLGIADKVEIEEGEHLGQYAWAGEYALAFDSRFTPTPLYRWELKPQYQ